MATWLVSSLQRTTNKGSAAATATTDSVETTSNKGERTTTVAIPEKTTTQNIPQKTTTRATSGNQTTTGTNTVTVHEDAGGQIAFRIPVRNGLFTRNPTPICPQPLPLNIGPSLTG
jgi:hypothetical protein